MKKYIILSCTALCLYMTACDDFLNVEPRGADTVPAQEVVNDPNQVESVLRSAYTVLGSEKYFGGRQYIISDLLSDDLNGGSLTQDYGSIYNHRTSVFDDYKNKHFSELYIAVYRANVVLENLAVFTDEVKRNEIKGEALFIRAISHFEAVRLYAQPYGFTEDNSHPGIPLRYQTKPVSLQRATVDMVYKAVIEDLKEASSLLSGNRRGYADKYAALGFLARVHFQMNDFESAYAYANQVIENGEFSLDEEITTRFSENESTEAVFELVSNGVAANRTDGLRDNYRSDVTKQPTLSVSQNFFNQLTQDDQRRVWFTTEAFPGFIATTKFNFSWANNVVLSLTELKLIRAESAAAMNTNLEVARQDINDILNRAYSGNRVISESAPAQTIINTAREQRRLEFFGEGVRIHELKRIGVLEGDVRIRGALWSCPGMVLQFPQGEIANTPDFERNPEGGC